MAVLVTFQFTDSQLIDFRTSNKLINLKRKILIIHCIETQNKNTVSLRNITTNLLPKSLS